MMEGSFTSGAPSLWQKLGDWGTNFLDNYIAKKMAPRSLRKTFLAGKTGKKLSTKIYISKGKSKDLQSQVSEVNALKNKGRLEA